MNKTQLPVDYQWIKARAEEEVMGEDIRKAIDREKQRIRARRGDEAYPPQLEDK